MTLGGRLVKYIRVGNYLKIHEVASLCNLHPETIEKFVQLGLIDPVDRDQIDGSWIFDESVVPIIKKIVRLRNELGINYAGIGVVLDLLDRLDHIERRLKALEDKVADMLK